jgi:hypothetical protein
MFLFSFATLLIIEPDRAQARTGSGLVFGLSLQPRPRAHPPGQAHESPSLTQARILQAQSGPTFVVSVVQFANWLLKKPEAGS